MPRIEISERDWNSLAASAAFRVEDLAQLRRISTRQLRRQLQRAFGRSPQQWLSERRMARAEELLLEGNLIKCVAFELGFKQTSHFCRLFKTFKRMTPSEFVSAAAAIADTDNKWPERQLRSLEARSDKVGKPRWKL